MKEKQFKLIHPNFLNSITDWRNYFQEVKISRQRKLWAIGLFIMLVGVVVLDYHTGRYINLFSLYLFPIMFVTWKLGFKIGLAYAILSCLCKFTLETFLQPEAGMTLLFTTELTHFAVLVFLIFSSRKIQTITEHFIKMGLHDALTGINNRRAFFIQGQTELKRMVRAKQPMSLLFMDLDNFKTINDTYGHATGDEVLQSVAYRIETRLREIDFFARLSGDEFAIILPFTDGDGALELGTELHATLQKGLSNKNISIGSSIGIATFAQAPDSFSYALKCADNVMYDIKKSTKNAVAQRNF